MFTPSLQGARARLDDAEAARDDAFALFAKARLPAAAAQMATAAAFQLRALAQATGVDLPAHGSLADLAGTLAAAGQTGLGPIQPQLRRLDALVRAVHAPGSEQIRPARERIAPDAFTRADFDLRDVAVLMAELLPPGLGIWDEPDAEAAPGTV